MRRLLPLLGLLLLPTPLFALTCDDLSTPAKIRAFVLASRDANPLARERLSAHLEVSACEGEECQGDHRDARLKRMQNVHLVREGDNRRAYVAKGPRSPQCSVRRGERTFLCAECRYTENTACRSFAPPAGPTRIEGTNIDTTDFDLVAGDSYRSICEELPESRRFLKITSTRQKGDSPFDTVISFYEKERGVPVTFNYLAGGVLRKVYRFFPRYYVKIGDQWAATIIRVRTTKGVEHHYVFETQVRIQRDEQNRPLLYFSPGSDPALNGGGADQVFRTP